MAVWRMGGRTADCGTRPPLVSPRLAQRCARGSCVAPPPPATPPPAPTASRQVDARIVLIVTLSVSVAQLLLTNAHLAHLAAKSLSSAQRIQPSNGA